MPYDFDFLPNRRGSDSMKWLEYGEDVLPMWVADMDFISPPAVLRALQERVAHGVFGYGIKTQPLVEAVVERMQRLYRWQVMPEDVVLLPGVIPGFHLACLSICDEKQGVLVQTPVYTPILHAAQTTHRLPQEAPLTIDAQGYYGIDWDTFEKAIGKETRLFILSNPHNPVGRVFHQDELLHMAEICLNKGVVICSDEIHCDLIYPGHAHIPIASLDREIAQNSITLMSPSKTYNLAGLKCSYAIIQNPELRKKYLGATHGLISSVNLLGLTAGLAAYKEGDDWLAELLMYLTNNREVLGQFIQSNLPGISMYNPEGTYLAWLDCRNAGIPGNAGEFFLKNARVALNDGRLYGKEGEGFVRLNYGCPQAMLRQALERMEKAIMILGIGKNENR
ncbi:MAG: PatB family C-S lyase [Anaerolineales bacterium]|nr:PatB family C-S lyase [Anaerolineales bacterium]